MIKNLDYMIAGFSIIIGIIPIFLETNVTIYFVPIYRIFIITCALIICSYLLLKKEKKLRNFLIPLHLGLFFFLLSEILTFVHNLNSNEILLISLNITFILSYLPIYYLLINKTRKDQPYISKNITLVTLFLTALVLALVSPIIVAYGRKSLAENNILDFVITFIYVIVDLDILSMSIVLVILNRKLRFPYFWLMIVGAWLFIFAGDASMAYFLTHSMYYTGSAPDLIYNVSYAIFFVGLILMTERHVDPTSVFEIDRERQYYQTMYNEISILVDDIITVTSLLRHDLHNDIVVIQNSLELFQETKEEIFLEKLNNRIEIIINRLAGITTETDLLESVIEQPVDLNVIFDVANLFDKATVVSPPKNIQLKASKLLYPILVNLTQNAFQHGGDDIDVELEYEELNEYVLIKIKDNGKGIEDEGKDRIFYRSYKKKESDGRGMGLYLARIAIERYGGSIFLEDNVPTGAIFVIKLQKC